MRSSSHSLLCGASRLSAGARVHDVLYLGEPVGVAGWCLTLPLSPGTRTAANRISSHVPPYEVGEPCVRTGCRPLNLALLGGLCLHVEVVHRLRATIAAVPAARHNGGMVGST